MLLLNFATVLTLALMLLALSPGASAQTKLQSPATASSPTISKSLVPQRPQPDRLSATEFTRLINELSEPGGYFRSDNFTSNETGYLYVVNKLREMGATGGAYIGVGPEQNFTYIAKIRPRIAFIVDIRRQAMIQHLMFKALFHIASTRTQYLSLLLSRPLPKDKLPPPDAAIGDIVTFVGQISSDDKAYDSNLASIRKIIKDEFKFELLDTDQTGLDYVYKNFRNDGLNIAYAMEGTRGSGWFPSLKDLILQTDQHGKLGNFLASKEDYDFVRDLHRHNLIIPVVGDFGGTKALGAVGNYLRNHGYTVTAFYTSNVEQYLFQGGSFPSFAENVRKLPINDKSLFIRAFPNMRVDHPARVPGHRITTLLQEISVFLKDFDAGLYPTYFDLVTTHYIVGEVVPQ
jgi:hypothetical protein